MILTIPIPQVYFSILKCSYLCFMNMEEIQPEGDTVFIGMRPLYPFFYLSYAD